MVALFWKEVNPLQNEVCKEVDCDNGDFAILALKRLLHVTSWDAVLVTHLRDGGCNVRVEEHCKQ